MSPRSPKALYHSIPQAPVAANPVVLSDLYLEESQDDGGLDPDTPTVVVDSRVRGILFILGCAVLLPWNVMITATPFLPGSTRQLILPLVVRLISLLRVYASSPSRRVLTTTLSLSFLTFLLIVSTFFHTSPGLFFAFVLFDGVSQAALGAYLTTAVIVIASLFGSTAVQALMSGQAAVAVAVSGVQVFSAVTSVWGQSPETISAYVSNGEPEENAAFIFFSLSAAIFVVSAAAYSWLVTMPAYKTVAGSLEQKKIVDGSPDELRGLVSAGRSESSNEKGQIWRVAKANVMYEVAVCYVFVVTLAVFPAITTSILPTNPNTHPLLFSAIHFLTFNVGDFLGRYACSFPRLLIWSASRLLILSASRTLFVPLFLMCNLRGPSVAGVPSSPIISFRPHFLLRGRRKDVDLAATVANFCLVGGLVLGSICSFAVRAAVCDCNPFTEH
ncbi:nucleoside transporter-domain-containing protein [Mycena rebaudengoi]|nr:nucleoside transporter-domain-containing protein [Mycena rebaudengoi]